ESYLLDGAFETVASVINENVDAAGLFLRFFNATPHARLIGDIETYTDGLTGSEFLELGLCRFIADCTGNRIAFGEHRLSQGPPKSTADAGDEPVGHSMLHISRFQSSWRADEALTPASRVIVSWSSARRLASAFLLRPSLHGHVRDHQQIGA